MPVIEIAAGAVLSLFSGAISLIMSLPNSIKLLVFYAMFLGLGFNFPGTDVSIGNNIISPIIGAAFGVIGLSVDYGSLKILFGIILLLYYAHFFHQMGGN